MSFVAVCARCSSGAEVMFSLETCGHRFCHPCLNDIYMRSVYTCSKCLTTSRNASEIKATVVKPPSSAASYPQFAAAAAPSRPSPAPAASSLPSLRFGSHAPRGQYSGFALASPDPTSHYVRGDMNKGLLCNYGAEQRVIRVNSLTPTRGVTIDVAEQHLNGCSDGDWIVKDSEFFSGGHLLFMCKQKGKIFKYALKCDFDKWSLSPVSEHWYIDMPIINGETQRSCALTTICNHLKLNPPK